MATARNEEEYRRLAERRDQLTTKRLMQGMEMVLDLTAGRMRETTAFRDRTGNLRSSIGVDQAVSAGTPPPAPELPVRIESGGIVGILGIGMEYAPHVDQRTHFTDEAINEVPRVAEKVFADVLKLVDKEL